MAAIGVHFGYTCACVAVFKDGRADVVANDAGDRVTPAVVGYRDVETTVGASAKTGRGHNAANTVVNVKQVLGRSFQDPETQKHRAESECPVVNKDEAPRYVITAGGKTKHVAPEEVAKLVFRKMKETAQSAVGSTDVTVEAVVAVPWEFSRTQKDAVREAAEAAGLRVLRLVHEPAAALLAYGVGQEEDRTATTTGEHQSHNALVYKLGGTSLSVTALAVTGGMFRVLAHDTDPGVGGESFTRALATHLAQEFKRSFKGRDVSGNARAMRKLMAGADAAKHTLSTLGTAHCLVDSLHDGVDLELSVSRARFELLCSPLFDRSVRSIGAVLEQAGLTAGDIRTVVLCGGSVRIPRLQRMIRDLFSPDVELLSSAPPDEVVALGAAVEAGLLVGRGGGPSSSSLEEESVAVDACASDILVKELHQSGAEVFTLLLPSGTPLPARRHHVLSGRGRLPALCLELYQRTGGAEERPERLAKVVLRGLEPEEEDHRVDAVLTMNRDGSLHVSCVDQTSGRSEAVTIAAAS